MVEEEEVVEEEVEGVVVTSPLLPTPLIVSLSSTITATAEARPVRARTVRERW